MQGYQWYGAKRNNLILANEGNCAKSFGQFFNISRSIHFFNKIDFERYFFEIMYRKIKKDYSKRFARKTKFKAWKKIVNA